VATWTAASMATAFGWRAARGMSTSVEGWLAGSLAEDARSLESSARVNHRPRTG
jgi:hypothetical protein